MSIGYNKSGGPAFVVHHPDIASFAHGMTVRDFFAGQALAGLMANPDYSNTEDGKCAGWAYQAADAMMAAREKGADDKA